MTDYEAAKKTAAETDKDLLLEFTRSDWCPTCMELTGQVFSTEAFTTGAEAKFVLVVLDFPRDESRLAAGVKEQNEALATRYGIDAFPTVVLADARGRPYARTGLRTEGPEAYLKHLDELQEFRKERDAMLSAGRTLDGVAKAKVLQNALAEFPDAIVEAFYGDVAAEVEAADPEDESGFQKARVYRRELAACQERVGELFEAGEFEEVFQETDRFMEVHRPNGIDKQRILLARVMAYAETGRKDEALQVLADMKAVAPYSDVGLEADRCKGHIERIFAQPIPERQ
jgi:thiol-disulfide isomerase/thioredoxin